MAYFIDDIIRATRVPPDRATHFALYRGDRARYYIALEDGMGRTAGRRLSANVSAYSGKLDGLMRLLGRMPYRALQLAHIGAYVSLELDGQVSDALDAVRRDALRCGKIWWNVLVGSYVEKQKAVFQCFRGDDAPAVYMKVGDSRSSAQMLAEAAYLQSPIPGTLLRSPRLCLPIQGEGKYRMQITEEFTGERVAPVLSEDIYRLFREIADSRTEVDAQGRALAFSHGDFTPWNMKKQGDAYMVFDWEYCGMRFYGFDLIHFVWQVQHKLCGKTEGEAMAESIRAARQFDERLRSLPDAYIEEQYMGALRQQFGEVL